MAGDNKSMTEEDAMVIARKLVEKGMDIWKVQGSSSDNISVVLCFFINYERESVKGHLSLTFNSN